MVSNRSSLYSAIIFFAVFLAMAYFVKSGIFFQGIDKNVSSFFSERQSNYGLQIMRVISFFGSKYFLPAFVIIISLGLYLKKNKDEGKFLFATFAGGAVLGELIKAGFGRTRPENLFEQNFSFPSIHALSAVVGFGTLAYLLWNKNPSKLWGFLSVKNQDNLILEHHQDAKSSMSRILLRSEFLSTQDLQKQANLDVLRPQTGNFSRNKSLEFTPSLSNKNRKVSYGLIIFGLTVGFSRIYLNVHWLSDVIAGFILGAAFLSMGIWLFFTRNK